MSKKSFKRKLLSVLFETRQRLLTLCNHDNARNAIAKSQKRKLLLLILVLMNSQRIDVLAIIETKLDFSIRDTDVYLPGFEIIRLGAGKQMAEMVLMSKYYF